MPEKRVQNKDNLQRGLAFAYRVGDYFENRLGSMIENTPIGAPVLGGEMDAFTWYRIPIKDGISGDGSEYYIYAKKGFHLLNSFLHEYFRFKILLFYK